MLAQAYSNGDSGAGAVILLVWLAIGVAIALWSGSAARRKGYSYGVGFVLGLFLGLIGRIIVGVLPDKRPRFVPGRPL